MYIGISIIKPNKENQLAIFFLQYSYQGNYLSELKKIAKYDFLISKCWLSRKDSLHNTALMHFY